MSFDYWNQVDALFLAWVRETDRIDNSLALLDRLDEAQHALAEAERWGDVYRAELSRRKIAYLEGRGIVIPEPSV